MIRKIFVFVFLFGNMLLAQEAVNLKLGGGISYTNYFYEPLDYERDFPPEINIEEATGVNFDANVEFRLSKYVQFESGLSYQRFVMNFTFFNQSQNDLGGYSTLEAYVKQTNNLLYIPIGGSFVLPYKKSEFLVGVRFFVGFSKIDKEGTWDYYGKRVTLQPDSTITSEDFNLTYKDNEIGGVLNPRLSTQFHFTYQYRVSNKWQVYAKAAAGKGELSRNYGLNYWQYSGQVGIVYKLIDYKEKRKTMDEREQKRLPFPR